jgi:hypothetical protein
MDKFYDKYIKYKFKYLNLKNKINLTTKIGGKLEGIGGHGIVVSEPRLPLVTESFDQIKELNQVSKILYFTENVDGKIIKVPADETYFNQELTRSFKLNTLCPEFFSPENVILPLNPRSTDGTYIGLINNAEYKDNKTSYDAKWSIDPRERDTSLIVENKKILESVLDNDLNKYQIIFNKGININSLCGDCDKFIQLMFSPILLVNECNNRNIYFIDFKFDNIILHDNKIKLIDFNEYVDLSSTNEYAEFDNLKRSDLIKYYFYYFNSILISPLVMYYSDSMRIILNVTQSNILLNGSNGSSIIRSGLTTNIVSCLKFYDFVNSYRNGCKSHLENIELYYKMFASEAKKIQYNSMSINMDVIDILNGGSTVNINIHISDVVNTYKELYLLNLSNEEIEIINYNKLYDTESIYRAYAFYLNNKYRSQTDIDINKKLIIKELMKTNSMYSVGFCFISFFTNCRSDFNCRLKLIKIIILCLSRVVLKTDESGNKKIYITTHDVDNVLEYLRQL